MPEPAGHRSPDHPARQVLASFSDDLPTNPAAADETRPRYPSTCDLALAQECHVAFSGEGAWPAGRWGCVCLCDGGVIVSGFGVVNQLFRPPSGVFSAATRQPAARTEPDLSTPP